MKEYLTDERKQQAQEVAAKTIRVVGSWTAANTVRAVLPWLFVIGGGLGFLGFLAGLFVGWLF